MIFFTSFSFLVFPGFCAPWFVAGLAGAVVSGGADCRWGMHVTVGVV